MAKRPDASRDDTSLCPDCGGDLTFVASWTFRGLWGYNEVHTYECATHGPLFVRAEGPITRGISETAGHRPDGGDRDSLIPVRRGPKPVLESGAIAVAEPDSD
jgi:hypothetical protein